MESEKNNSFCHKDRQNYLHLVQISHETVVLSHIKHIIT